MRVEDLKTAHDQNGEAEDIDPVGEADQECVTVDPHTNSTVYSEWLSLRQSPKDLHTYRSKFPTDIFLLLRTCPSM